MADKDVAHSIVVPKEVAERIGPLTEDILNRILPYVIAKFVMAADHYGDANPFELGTRGQFADIWRKVGPLRRALWDGVELTRESPREILEDLIGHCLLTIAMLDEASGRGPKERGSWEESGEGRLKRKPEPPDGEGESRIVMFNAGNGRSYSGRQTKHCKMAMAVSASNHRHDVRCVEPGSGEVADGTVMRR